MKDRFLSAVSHELRTPITICRGHLEVLEDRADEREVRAVKAMCVSELALMGRLVDDLTTLAWADDRALLKVESLRLDDFMESMAAKAETILGDRVRVVSGIAGGTLRADPQRLTQALVNLLQNAADHAKGDGPVCLRVQAGPASWRFEVADDGGGLPLGDEQVVFEPFSTGSSRGGMGLGLAIVRAIARAHGGEADADQPARARRHVLDQDPAVTLLVVEDEQRLASFLNKGLRAHGYNVEWVNTGQDALRRLAHPGISLVILDLGLPDLDGLDVLAGPSGTRIGGPGPGTQRPRPRGRPGHRAQPRRR